MAILNNARCARWCIKASANELFDAASGAYLTVLQLDSTYVPAYLALGELPMQWAEGGQAVAAFSLATRLEPRSLQARQTLQEARAQWPSAIE